jgi:hypothetical protein
MPWAAAGRARVAAVRAARDASFRDVFMGWLLGGLNEGTTRVLDHKEAPTVRLGSHRLKKIGSAKNIHSFM